MFHSHCAPIVLWPGCVHSRPEVRCSSWMNPGCYEQWIRDNDWQKQARVLVVSDSSLGSGLLGSMCAIYWVLGVTVPTHRILKASNPTIPIRCWILMRLTVFLSWCGVVGGIICWVRTSDEERHSLHTLSIRHSQYLYTYITRHSITCNLTRPIPLQTPLA